MNLILLIIAINAFIDATVTDGYVYVIKMIIFVISLITCYFNFLIMLSIPTIEMKIKFIIQSFMKNISEDLCNQLYDQYINKKTRIGDRHNKTESMFSYYDLNNYKRFFTSDGFLKRYNFEKDNIIVLYNKNIDSEYIAGNFNCVKEIKVIKLGLIDNIYSFKLFDENIYKMNMSIDEMENKIINIWDKLFFLTIKPVLFNDGLLIKPDHIEFMHYINNNEIKSIEHEKISELYIRKDKFTWILRLIFGLPIFIISMILASSLLLFLPTTFFRCFKICFCFISIFENFEKIPFSLMAWNKIFFGVFYFGNTFHFQIYFV